MDSFLASTKDLEDPRASVALHYSLVQLLYGAFAVVRCVDMADFVRDGTLAQRTS